MFQPEANPYSPPVHQFDSDSNPEPSNVGREYSGKFQDVWASVLFYLHYFAIICVAVYGTNSSNESDSSTSPPPPPSTSQTNYDIKNWAPQLALASLIAFVFSFIWLQLIKLIPKWMIYVSLYWSAFSFFGIGVFILFYPSSSKFVAIIFFAFGLISLLYAYLVRNRIPFASAILTKSVSIIKKYPSTIWVSYLFLIISIIFLGVWMFGVAAAMSLSSNVMISIAFIFSLYWTFEVLRNSVHVTVSGTVGTYYFNSLSMPPNPTLRSLNRAMTKSFGSICLGSLIVSVIQTIRVLVIYARQNANAEGNLLEMIICCCLDYILSLLQDAIQYLNKWAYVQVALYGKNFVRAAKDTWELFKNQGLEMLINDDLTGNVLSMGSLISGLTCATATGLWTYSVNKDLTWAVMLIAFLIGFLMTNQALAVVESAISCYYVCFADDPLTLERTDPVFYQIITERHKLLIQA